MRRTPVVGTIAPWIRARLDRAETVVAVAVGQGTTDATEVRVDGRQIAVLLVPIAPPRVGLPHLHQGMGNRLAILVTHPTGDDDALADGQAAVVEVQQQIVIVMPHLQVGKIRAAGFRLGLRDAHQGLARGPQD